MSQPLGTLTITVHKGSELFNTNIIATQDPFVQLTFRGVTRKTKVHVDGGRAPTFEQTLEPLVIPSEGCSIQVSAYANNMLIDTLIGTGFLAVDDLIKNGSMPRWYRIGRDYKQTVNAGLLSISAKWEPNPLLAPKVVAVPKPKPSVYPPGMLNEQFDEVDLAAPSEYNLNGDWRVYTKDVENKERGYTISFVHSPDGSIVGHGEAAHMPITIAGSSRGDSIQYRETWAAYGANIGEDNIDAKVSENGALVTAMRPDGSILLARKASTISKHSHPEFFLPYYNLSGSWRVYALYSNNTHVTYGMEIKQDEHGVLTGGGAMDSQHFTLKGTFDKNIINYSENWGGSDDVISATLNPSGAYFKCATNNAVLQEAKRVDSMTEQDRKHYGLK